MNEARPAAHALPVVTTRFVPLEVVVKSASLDERAAVEIRGRADAAAELRAWLDVQLDPFGVLVDGVCSAHTALMLLSRPNAPAVVVGAWRAIDS